MTRLTNAVGAYGERVAMRTLALAGMAILDRNWRCAEGKVRRLRAAAARWLAAHPRERGELRFDVISVWPQRTGPPRIEHVEGAF